MQLYFFYSILFHIIYSLRGRPRPCRENFIVKSFPVANTVHLGEKKKEGWLWKGGRSRLTGFSPVPGSAVPLPLVPEAEGSQGSPGRHEADVFTRVSSFRPASRVVGRFRVTHTGRMWHGTIASVRQDVKFDGVFSLKKIKVALFNLKWGLGNLFVTSLTFTPNIENKKTKNCIMRHTIACFAIIIFQLNGDQHQCISMEAEQGSLAAELT